MDIFTTLGSVAFGWLLSGTGQWLKGKREDRRIKKIVLYNLLETHHLFKQLDTSKDINQISEIVFEVIPLEERSEELKIGIARFYKLYLQKMVEEHASEGLSKLEESFTKAIDELSKVDPINAFSLKGKTRIQVVFNLFATYFEQIKNDFPEDAYQITQVADISINEMRPNIISDALKDLEEEIKKISISIGLLTRFKVNKIINKRDNPMSEENKENIVKYFKNIMPELSQLA